MQNAAAAVGNLIGGAAIDGALTYGAYRIADYLNPSAYNSMDFGGGSSRGGGGGGGEFKTERNVRRRFILS
jgi:hypothetical protein